MVKKFVLLAVACACVGSYTVAGAQGTLDVKPDPAKPVVAEQAAPMVGMPSPIHEFATIDEAAKYMNIMPHLPKVLPVGYNIESVSTINRVTATEKVNGTKVTFKGGEKMVYLAGWTKDGQNHAMYFERPVNRDMAKAIIANTVAPTAHTAYTK